MSSNTKPGRESKVTVELIERVSKLVAKGIPVRAALKAESVSYVAYRQHLRRHPELAAIHAAAKIKFLENTFETIFSRPNHLLRWIVERRHPDLLRPDPDETDDDETEAPAKPESTRQTIAGVPEHLLDEARKEAQNAPYA